MKDSIKKEKYCITENPQILKKGFEGFIFHQTQDRGILIFLLDSSNGFLAKKFGYNEGTPLYWKNCEEHRVAPEGFDPFERGFLVVGCNEDSELKPAEGEVGSDTRFR